MEKLEEQNNLLIYKNKDGNIVVDAIYKDETLWLTQKGMAKVFDCSIDNISLHLKNIFKDNELDENSVVENSSITASDGKNYKTKIYNLDAIIAVGYRVNSKKATEFRIWATKVLREYLITGFVMDDERLKNPNYIFGEDYFERLLERIRNIRSSERRFYQKITDIYSSCSIDYDKDSKITKKIFKTVQNKLHYAVTAIRLHR